MKIEDLKTMKEKNLKNKCIDNTNGYESPVKLIQKSFDSAIEDKVITLIQEYDVTIDKDELIKALNYDRNQFSLGYGSGFEDGYNGGYDDCIKNMMSILEDMKTKKLNFDFKELLEGTIKEKRNERNII